MQSTDSFVRTPLCICVTCFQFTKLTFALHLFFQWCTLVIDTTVNRLNFCWFPPDLHFRVFTHELHSATRGSSRAFRFIPTSPWKKIALQFFLTLVPEPSFINLKQFLLVRYKNKNFEKYLLQVHEIMVAVKETCLIKTLRKTDIEYPCPEIFVPSTSVLHGSKGCARLHHTLRGCFHAFQFGSVES